MSQSRSLLVSREACRTAFSLNDQDLDAAMARLQGAGAIEAFTPPPIGSTWAGQHGMYAGLVRGVDGGADYHLILALDKPSKLLKWQAAMDWAAGLGDGFALPTRRESALLFANLKDQFDLSPSWHWTCEQYSASYAYNQLFSSGYQYFGGKSYEARARAVRRFIA